MKDLFASAVQSGLDREHEVINIAASGLNTPQEIHLLEREGLRYDPDLVVLNFVLNDVDFYTRFGPAKRHAAENDSKIGMFNLRIDPRVKRWLKSSAAIYFVKHRVENLWARVRNQEDVDYFGQLWATGDNRQKVISGFAQLVNLQTDRHFAVVVVIWPLITEYKSYRFAWIHDWVASEATKAGFCVIDLLPALSKIPYRDLQVTGEDNVHPNARDTWRRRNPS